MNNCCALIKKNQQKDEKHRQNSDLLTPERLGVVFPNRLSFTRTLLRRLDRENWQISREFFDLNKEGIGTAVYKIDTQSTNLWFVIFTDKLDQEDRNDRVIAERWDATFTLTKAEPTPEVLERLRSNIPLQEKGRCSSEEIILSRANKSVRIFNYVASMLAAGQQPDSKKLLETGYLIRTTAVYGNGKFGLADFKRIQRDNVFLLPFQAEMLTVYLARHFSFEWVEHVARMKNPNRFVPIAENLKKELGVGNSTGLGMVPFLVEHPQLICRWISVREEALVRVLNLRRTSTQKRNTFRTKLDASLRHLEQWHTDDLPYRATIEKIKVEVVEVIKNIPRFPNINFWQVVVNWCNENFCLATQEFISSIIVELHPELVDDLENFTGVTETYNLNPKMTLGRLMKIISKNYSWVNSFKFNQNDSIANFWYRSIEKEEPRLGHRFFDEGAEKEIKVGIAYEISKLESELDKYMQKFSDTNIAEFLKTRPFWRTLIMRIQSLELCSYAEIQANLLDQAFRPIDLLRFKLAMFGATKFDPKSDLWLRVSIFQGAPLIQGLQIKAEEDCLFPLP
tara:strand:- start:1441 stop:3141 length:1701 start_codon:yes stop_codon:yes gene_type:complete